MPYRRLSSLGKASVLGVGCVRLGSFIATHLSAHSLCSATRSGRDLYARFQRRAGAEPESRVLLAREADRYRVPRLKIEWRASELDWLTLSRMLCELRRAVEECDCGTIEYDERRRP